jgi:uncharacterized protein YbjT (DUF2867 family)
MKVLVTGATGTVGGEVVKALLQRGADVRALARKQPKPGMFPGAVEIALGDLSDPVSVAEAIKGVDELFLLIGNVGDELTQALTAYGLSKKAGLKHVTYLSVLKADQFLEVPHFAAKYACPSPKSCPVRTPLKSPTFKIITTEVALTRPSGNNVALG